MKRFVSLLLGLLVQQLVVVSFNLEAHGNTIPAGQHAAINFLSPSGFSKAIISCEIADTPMSRNRGLMYRKHLPQNQGMLFIFQSTKLLSFYMKNTYIPLDILFLDEKNTIIKIYENTTPLSTKQLPSNKPVCCAVEVNAGYCASHKIGVGDKIIYSFSGMA